MKANSSAYGSGNWESRFKTNASSDVKITYTFEELFCLSGYKVDGCENKGLSGWTINVSNSTDYWIIQTDSKGYWTVCKLENGTYNVCEVPQSGWVQTAPTSGCDIRTISGANISDINFTNVPTGCISGYKLNNCTKSGIFNWLITLNNSTYTTSMNTDSDGYYEFCGLMPGSYTITETIQPGWVSVTPAVLSATLPCGYNLTNQNFTNQKTLCISGYKRDDCTKAGLPGWTVSLANGSYSATTVTGLNGYYEFCGLMPGVYTITETIQPGWVSVAPAVLSSTLLCSNNLTNQKTLCISGYKRDDCTKAGLPGWTVSLENGSYSTTTVTDQNGYYEFCGLMPGSYTITETIKPGWNAVTPAVLPVTLSCSNNLTNQNFTNQQTLCISGYKLNDCTKAGIPGWLISIHNGTYTASQRTGADGKYEFCGLLPGTYTVTEESQSGWVATSSASISVALTCSSNATNYNFTNVPVGCISGYKLNGCTNDGISNWLITINNSTYTTSQRTDADGKYEFCDLVPGTYTVTEESQSGWIATSSASISVDLTCAGSETDKNFTNVPTKCLSGFKFNEQQQPLAGWTIQVSNSSGLVDSAITDDSGYWVVCNLAPGSYDVSEVLQSGYQALSPTTVSVSIGNCDVPNMINFTNTKTACLSGYKINETGIGLSGWTIEISNSTGYVWNPTTDSNGYWSQCGLANGTYTVCEILQAGWIQLDPASCYDTVSLSGVDIPNLNFTNTNVQCISGHKYDTTTGSGLRDWIITATNDDTGAQYTATTDPDGYWEICGLTKGKYTVCEALFPGWGQVGPSTPDGCYHITVGMVDINNLDFTNDPRGMCLSGHKYNNLTGAGLAGWEITVSNFTYSTKTTTNDTGYWQVCGLFADTYTVHETLKPGWRQISPNGDYHVALVFRSIGGIDFYNEQLPCLSGHKFIESTGLGVAGWTITVSNSTHSIKTKTNGSGYWELCDLYPGNYKVCEETRDHWLNVSNLCYDVTLGSTSISDIDFYNEPDYIVHKVADKTSAHREEEITYTITVCNPLNDDWKSVNITDVFSREVIILYPVEIVGKSVSWIDDIPAHSCKTYTVVARVPKTESKFQMDQSVSGEGFVNVHNDYSTSLEGFALRNCVYVYHGSKVYSDCAVVSIDEELGTEIMTKEHGSGTYDTEHKVIYNTENFSIEDYEDVSATYKPTKFQLPANRSIDYNTLWIKKYKAKNFITGASMTEEYTFAKNLNREGSMKVDKNESIMKVNSSFVGQAHLGFLKKANPDSPAKIKPIFEMQEDYTGAFNIQENVNEYGKSVRSNKSASGEGYVAVDKRIKDSQRTYESGTGTYKSEELIDTPTNYMYKDLQVGSRPSSFSYTPRVKTSQDLLWSEGMISKTSGSTLRGGTLVNAASTCGDAQCTANCSDDSGLTNQTVTYMSEKYSGIQSMNKTTQAIGLNEMKTEATFQGTADYRTLVTAPNRTSIVDDEERYVGSYDIKRHTLATGTSKYDEPHLTVTSEAKTEERWYNNTDALIATYNIHLTNDGNRALGPISVRDMFPPGTEYVYSSIKPSSLSATMAEWTLISLGIGNSIDIQLELNVTDINSLADVTVDALYGDLVNRVDAYGSYSTGIARGSSYAVVPSTWLGACSPELDIKKKAVLDSSDKTLVDYQIVLKNTANYPMAVTVTDYLPSSMELVETAETPANYGPGRAQWVINTLPAGETVTLDYVARALTDGQHVNRVKAEGVAITGEGTATSEAETSIYVSGTGSQPYTLRYGGWQPPAWELNTTVDGWYTSSPGVSVDEVA